MIPDTGWLLEVDNRNQDFESWPLPDAEGEYIDGGNGVIDQLVSSNVVTTVRAVGEVSITGEVGFDTSNEGVAVIAFAREEVFGAALLDILTLPELEQEVVCFQTPTTPVPAPPIVELDCLSVPMIECEEVREQLVIVIDSDECIPEGELTGRAWIIGDGQDLGSGMEIGA